MAAQAAIAAAAARAELFADPLRKGQCTPQDFLRDVMTQAHDAVLGRARLEPRLAQMGPVVPIPGSVARPRGDPAMSVIRMSEDAWCR